MAVNSCKPQPCTQATPTFPGPGYEASKPIKELQKKVVQLRAVFAYQDFWSKVQKARSRFLQRLTKALGQDSWSKLQKAAA